MTSAPPCPPHLLVVDDDEKLPFQLQRYLNAHGHICNCAQNADEAMQLLELYRYDLIIMDVMMPEMDGIELTGKLRERIDTPILFLSAKGETDDRIAGLKAGGDDYLPKPYEPSELLARVEVLLRRTRLATERPPSRHVSLGAYRFDVARGELLHGDMPVHLTDFERRLMERLARTPGEAVGRDELLEGGIAGGSRSIDIQVSRLRRKFEVNPRMPRYLLTARGEGYRLRPD